MTLIAKTETYVDKKESKTKRRSPVGKNEYVRPMVQQAAANQIPFRSVRNDVWFASADNMMFIKHTVAKDFVMPLKTNRKVARSAEDKKQGRYVQVETRAFELHVRREVSLEAVDFPLVLVKHVFVNEGGRTGVLYLVARDTTLTYEGLTTFYRLR